VIAGTAAAVQPAHLRVLPLIAALLTALLIQIGTNFANDVFDFQRGADTHQRLGPARITQSGQVTPQRVLAATAIAFSLAALIGLYLIAVGGWPILLIGVLSILAGLAYTGSPFPLAYHGLGDPACFIFFGPIAVAGSAWLQTHQITPLVMAVSIPVGLLVTAILIVNNVRDIDTDRAAGKRTLAVRLGRNGTRIEYIICVTGAYVVPLALLVHRHHLPWLPLFTLPLAVSLIRTVIRETAGPPLNRALRRTGMLHLLFGSLLAAGLWL